MGILLLQQVTDDDIHNVGEKVVKLAKLREAFPMPMGFVIDKNVFNDFLRQTDLLEKIKAIETSINPDDKEELQAKVNKIQQMIVSTEMPKPLESTIFDQYDAINIDDSKPISEVVSDSSSLLVAVRASSVGYVDDKKLHMSFLNISGRERVIKAVQTVFASFYTANAVAYRLKNGIGESGMAVLIQKMVPAEASGMAYSTNPTNTEHMLVLACKGLGSAITNNVVIPDRYVLEKDSLEVMDMAVKKQEFMFVNDNDNNKTVKVPLKDRDSLGQKMNTKQIQDVAMRAKRIEKEFGRPQLIEFAIEKDNCHILQAQNIEGLDEIPEKEVEEEPEEPVAISEGNEEIVQSAGEHEDAPHERDAELKKDLKEDMDEPEEEVEEEPEPEEEQTEEEPEAETTEEEPETEETPEEEEPSEEGEEEKEEPEEEPETEETPEEEEPEPEEEQTEEAEEKEPEEENTEEESPIEDIKESSPMFEESEEDKEETEKEPEETDEDIETKDAEEYSEDDNELGEHEIIIAQEPEEEETDEHEGDSEVQDIAEQLAAEHDEEPSTSPEETHSVSQEVQQPHDPKTMVESTFQKAGSVVVSAHMAIQSVLYKKYLNKYGEEPSSFEQVMGRLKQENMVEHEDEIIRLRQIYVDFLERQKDPSPKDVKFSLELMQKFCD